METNNSVESISNPTFAAEQFRFKVIKNHSQAALPLKISTQSKQISKNS
jgi:hypothetical protein